METDPRIDEKISQAPAFARPILTHLRKLVHTGCPDVEETIKWQRSTFVYRGRILCGMVAFKEHCGFGFWHPKMAALVGTTHGAEKAEEGSGQFGRLTRVEDLPDDARMRQYIVEAMRLNEADQPAARSRPVAAPKAALEVPADLAALLGSNVTAAKVFAKFSPSHRREFIEWIKEAKRDETRQKRLASTLELLLAGKSLHWKYQRSAIGRSARV